MNPSLVLRLDESLHYLKVWMSPSLISRSGRVPLLFQGLYDFLPYIKAEWVPPLSQGLDDSFPYLNVSISPSLISSLDEFLPYLKVWISPSLISKPGWSPPLSQSLDESLPYLKVKVWDWVLFSQRERRVSGKLFPIKDGVWQTLQVFIYTQLCEPVNLITSSVLNE